MYAFDEVIIKYEGYRYTISELYGNQSSELRMSIIEDHILIKDYYKKFVPNYEVVLESDVITKHFLLKNYIHFHKIFRVGIIYSNNSFIQRKIICLADVKNQNYELYFKDMGFVNE